MDVDNEVVKFRIQDDWRLTKNAYPYLPRVTTASQGADDVILFDGGTVYTFEVVCGVATFPAPDMEALV